MRDVESEKAAKHELEVARHYFKNKKAYYAAFKRCEELGSSLEDLPPDELAAAHPALAELPEGLLSPRGSVWNKKSAGSTSPGSVEGQLEKARAFISGQQFS